MAALGDYKGESHHSPPKGETPWIGSVTTIEHKIHQDPLSHQMSELSTFATIKVNPDGSTDVTANHTYTWTLSKEGRRDQLVSASISGLDVTEGNCPILGVTFKSPGPPFSYLVDNGRVKIDVYSRLVYANGTSEEQHHFYLDIGLSPVLTKKRGSFGSFV